MEVKRIINTSPVSRPTWSKMYNNVKNTNGRYVRDPGDWWYVEIVQWANVVYTNGDDEEYPAIFGCYMETEDDCGGIGFVEMQDGMHSHYTTHEPAYMDCVDLKDGSGVKKTVRPDKFAAVSKEDLISALDRSKGSKKIAAKLLGIHRTTIFNIIAKYGLKDEYIKSYKR